MKKIKILTDSANFAFKSNKYLEVNIQCLEPNIFSEKVKDLFSIIFII